MQTREDTKTLVMAVLDDKTIQRRFPGEGDQWDDYTVTRSVLIEDIVLNEGTGRYEYRIKLSGQHTYSLMVRHGKTEGKEGRVFSVSTRDRLDEAHDDARVYRRNTGHTGYAYTPLYILHHEFDPETGALRNTDTIPLEEA